MALEVDGVNINSVEIDGVALKTVEFDGVLLLAPPTIKTQPVSSTILDNQEVVLKVVAESLGKDIKYQWQKNGANISGATAANYTHPKSAAGSYKYACVVSNKMGTIKTNEVTVTVNKSWVANFRLLVGAHAWFPPYEDNVYYGYIYSNVDEHVGALSPNSLPVAGLIQQIHGFNSAWFEGNGDINFTSSNRPLNGVVRIEYENGARSFAVYPAYVSDFNFWQGSTSSVHFMNYLKARQGSWVDIRVTEG